MRRPPLTDRVLTRDAVRAVDRIAEQRYGLSGLVLMENAGRGAADAIRRSLAASPGGRAGGTRPAPGGPVVIVAYRGNNGGDGFVVARHLDGAGLPVRVLLLCPAETVTGDAATNLAILQKTDVPATILPDPSDGDLDAALTGAAGIVDALLGTGATGVPRPPLDRAVWAMNRAGGRKFALDLPTGLDADTGAASDPTFRADETLTFAANKVGLTRPEAAEYVGHVTVLPIGVPGGLLDEGSGP